MGRYTIFHSCLAATSPNNIIGPWSYSSWAIACGLPRPPWLIPSDSDKLPEGCKIDISKPLPIAGWTVEDSARVRAVVDKYFELLATGKPSGAAERMLSDRKVLPDEKRAVKKAFDYMSKVWDVARIIKEDLKATNALPWGMVQYQQTQVSGSRLDSNKSVY